MTMTCVRVLLFRRNIYFERWNVSKACLLFSFWSFFEMVRLIMWISFDKSLKRSSLTVWFENMEKCAQWSINSLFFSRISFSFLISFSMIFMEIERRNLRNGDGYSNAPQLCIQRIFFYYEYETIEYSLDRYMTILLDFSGIGTSAKTVCSLYSCWWIPNH